MGEVTVQFIQYEELIIFMITFVERQQYGNGVFDFTDCIKEHNNTTCILMNGADNEPIEKLHVCMEDFNKYISGNYFYVRLKICYNDGKKYFYTTGVIHPTGYYVSYEMLETIVRYCLPIVDLIPMDQDEWGKNYKSKLALYGYNARKGELSERQRRNIVEFVLKHNFMSKLDVIHLLERNVQFVRNGYAGAIWRSDIAWLRQMIDCEE